MEEEKVEKLVSEYESKKDIYHAFAFAVRNILEIIAEDGTFKCQTAARGKSSDSLRKKLQIREIKSVTEMQDLAACRVLFYLESDIEKFTRFIYEQFDVDRCNVRSSNDDYNGVHFVVRLKGDRIALPEYSKFGGMVCEIQLTTILYHAWSEMAHDITYKPPAGLPEFDEYAYESLQKRFRTVMENHIKEASYDFDFINSQFEKIKQGKQVFSVDFLTRLEQLDSNNEIYQNLKILEEYVREFGDKTPNELGIIPLIKAVLEKSLKLKVRPIQTPIGELAGNNFDDIAKICIEIMDVLRYRHPDEILSILFNLSRAEQESTKQRALGVIGHLAKYNMHILQQVEYAAQDAILRRIETWSDRELLENLEGVIVIAREFLHPSFEGTSWQDEETAVFSSGVLVVNEKLREIRQKTIEILKKLYKLSDTLHDRESILRALDEAVRTPHQGSTTDMDTLVEETANDLVNFFIEIAQTSNTSGHILEAIEEQMRWLERRFVVGELHGITKLESLLVKNEEYQIFRVLVGYDGKLARNFDFEKDQKERPEKVHAFLRAINSKTLPLWRKRILSILKDYEGTDPGQYAYLNDLLEKLGRQKPSLARKMIHRNERELEFVLLPIVSGIWRSSSKNKVAMKALILEWIKAEKYLLKCAFLFVYIKEIDEFLFEQILKKAVETKNVRLFNTLLDSVVRNYDCYPKASEMSIKIIRELTKCQNASWIRISWYRQNFMEKFSAKDCDVILGNLLWLPSLNYEAEEILRPIAEKYPLKIVRFFHDRIAIETKRKKKSGEAQYDAIPFELHKVAAALAPHEKTIIPEIFTWYKGSDEKEGWLYRWDASHLLELLFPAIGERLELYVIEMIEEQGIEAIDNIFYLLGNYQGQDFLWNICMVIIKKFSSHEKYEEIKSGLIGVLSRTGVVSGEYGFAEAYERKKEAIKLWPNEGNMKLKKFLKEYGSFLEGQAISARKKATVDNKLRKRAFRK